MHARSRLGPLNPAGPLWDALRSVDGAPIWWKFSNAAVYGDDEDDVDHWEPKSYQEALDASGFGELRPLAADRPPPLVLTELEDLGVWPARLRGSLFDPPPRDRAPRAAATAAPPAVEDADGRGLLEALRARQEEEDASGTGAVLAAARRAGVYEGPADASELYAASRAVGGGGGATQMVPTT
eukprot:SAG22_NODE_514_length_9568_cov_10.711902_1_plen_182_part_10